MAEKPKLVYDAPKHQYLYEWQVGEYLWVSEPVFDSTREYVEALEAENAKLRELCEQCAIELYVNGNVTDAATENLFDDMRKLGVEVDV